MGGMRSGLRPKRVPLALIVSKYFLYVLISSVFAVGIPLGAFVFQMGSGAVLSANYGESHLEETRRILSGQASFDEGAVSSAYRYALFDANGALKASDMAGSQLDQARALAASTEGDGDSAVQTASYFFSVTTLAQGERCVLCYEIVPQWADKGTRDALPNPQDLFLWVAISALVVVIALIALRAGRRIAATMNPLLRAAEAVGRRDLDEPVSRSHVAEVDNVLQAMDSMRASLKESIEAQREAEMRNRDQVAALAHDLKTPLTIALGNADLLVEDAAEGKLNEESAACVDALRRAVLSMDGFVTKIVDASRGEAHQLRVEATDPSALADRLESAARRLVSARGFSLDVARSAAFRSGCADCRAGSALPLWDAEALERAVLNLVGNSCDHAAGGSVSLAFSHDADQDLFILSVEDDGPGFSQEALKRGAERFFRDDAARSNAGAAGAPHFGLGLSIASDIALAHGGTLALSNLADSEGNVLGAHAEMQLPYQRPLTRSS